LSKYDNQSLHYLKEFFSNSLIMTLFVDIHTKLLCDMSPLNIALETYMRMLLKMPKIIKYLWTYMWVLHI